MTRVIQPELLDEMPPEDAEAIRSRRDLRRLNAWMRSGATLARFLQSMAPAKRLDSIADLGGGDGTLLLNVLRRVDKSWRRRSDGSGQSRDRLKANRAVLVDRHDTVSRQTREGFVALGWQLELATTDVGEWLERQDRHGVILANLFWHHFSTAQLRRIFARIAGRANCFVAFEPRRSWGSVFFSNCVGLIGCGPVTRYDAPISVRAGFRGRELSALWPADAAWVLEEKRAGLFGHLFAARRVGATKTGT